MTTFVLRLYSPERSVDPGDVDLRGIVEAVATGHARTFRSGAELLDALAEVLSAAAPRTPS
ncbi:hypothetical protein [Pseudonocardia sp.]|uniref:hypothetical protein n=1 Tax=Pseudonocardia sp. TaxID=60912 RepID=UPI00261AB3C9|nr:hypothetical protein [Pseudonocardia sp.]